MERKIGITVIALLTIGIIFAAFKNFRSCTPSNISIPINENDSKVTISQKIIETYLQTHKSNKVCLRGLIKNYDISEITTYGFKQDGENSFVVTASFSVQPFLPFDNIYWVKQNGKIIKNGWVENNPVFLIITKNNKFYRLQEIIVKK